MRPVTELVAPMNVLFVVVASFVTTFAFIDGMPALAEDASVKGSSVKSTPSKSASAKNPDDSKPVYSPDRKKLAFIRTSKDVVSAGNGDVPADVVYLADASNPGAAQPLFKKGGKFKSGQQIGEINFGGIETVAFSPDSTKLYFLNAAYAVSGAIVEIDLKTRAIRYVIDGNSLDFEKSGKFKGNLLVARHKYDDNGAYNVLCIVSPAGKELKELKRLD